MDDIIKFITEDITGYHILLTILLVILGIWLREYNPPIKKQWQALSLFIVGAVLGYFLIQQPLIGVAISGLVYYKNVLIDELILIRKSLAKIDDKTTTAEDEAKNDNKQGDDK